MLNGDAVGLDAVLVEVDEFFNVDAEQGPF